MTEDIGELVKVRQEIRFAEFPLKSFLFYCIDQVMVLRNEYLTVGVAGDTMVELKFPRSARPRWSTPPSYRNEN